MRHSRPGVTPPAWPMAAAHAPVNAADTPVTGQSTDSKDEDGKDQRSPRIPVYRRTSCQEKETGCAAELGRPNASKPVRRPVGREHVAKDRIRANNKFALKQKHEQLRIEKL